MHGKKKFLHIWHVLVLQKLSDGQYGNIGANIKSSAIQVYLQQCHSNISWSRLRRLIVAKQVTLLTMSQTTKKKFFSSLFHVTESCYGQGPCCLRCNMIRESWFYQLSNCHVIKVNWNRAEIFGVPRHVSFVGCTHR